MGHHVNDGFCRQKENKSLRIPEGIMKIILSYFHDHLNERSEYISPENFGFEELFYLKIKYDDKYFYVSLWLRAYPFTDVVHIEQAKVILVSKTDNMKRKVWKASDLRLGTQKV